MMRGKKRYHGLRLFFLFDFYTVVQVHFEKNTRTQIPKIANLKMQSHDNCVFEP